MRTVTEAAYAAGRGKREAGRLRMADGDPLGLSRNGRVSDDE